MKKMILPFLMAFFAIGLLSASDFEITQYMDTSYFFSKSVPYVLGFSIVENDKVEVSDIKCDVYSRRSMVDYYGYSELRVKIPNYVEHNGHTYKVVRIGERAFADFADKRDYETEVRLPNTVKSIGKYAFRNAALSELRADSLVDISKGAFMNNGSMYLSRTLNDVTSIADSTFYGSTIPLANLPNVKHIGSYAFANTVWSREFPLPAELDSIGEGAFQNSSVETITTSSDLKYNLKYIGKKAFMGSQISSFDIPNSLRCIDDSAFLGCPQIESVRKPKAGGIGLPVGALSIGNGVFQNCGNLNSVDIYVDSIGDNMFKDDGKMTTLRFHEGLVSIGDSAFKCCSELKYINTTLPYSLKDIGDYAFYGCRKLLNGYYSSVTNSVLEIPNANIGKCAFSECSTLEKVIIGDGVQHIGDEAFSFAGSYNRNHIRIEFPRYGKINTIGASAFSGAMIINRKLCLDSIISIGENAFRSLLPGLDFYSVNIGSRVKSIGKEAFYECSDIDSVIISSGNVSIGDRAFIRCSQLSFVSIGGGIIGDNAFCGCSSLTTIKFGCGVYEIGRKAFYDCFDYYGVYDKVNVVPCVYMCRKNPPKIGGAAFGSSRKLSDIKLRPIVYVPCGSVSAYQKVIKPDFLFIFNEYYDGDIDDIPNMVLAADSIDSEALGKVDIVQYDTCDGVAVIEAVAKSKYVDSCLVFSHWNDGNTDNPRTIRVTKDTTILAHFRYDDRFVLTVNNDEEKGKVYYRQQNFYCYDTNVRLSCVPNKGYLFKEWDDGNTDNSRYITMTSDVTISPIYEKMTAIEDVVAYSDAPQKIVYEGQMYIVRNGAVYTVSGIKLRDRLWQN